MLKDIYKKLQIKPGMDLLVLNSPESYISDGEFEILPGTKAHLSPEKNTKYSFVQVFARNITELEQWGEEAVNCLADRGIFWVSHPKKSSKLYEDLSRDQGWDFLKKRGFEGVASIAVNENWSAIRFRPISEGTSPAKRKAIMKSPGAPVLRIPEEKSEMPEEFEQLLQTEPETQKRFESLAPSYQQSYIDWIVSAKRQETKDKRLVESMGKIKAGFKNPYAK